MIVGTGPAAWQLTAIANARFAVNKAVISLTADNVASGQLPPVLNQTLPHLPGLTTIGSGAMALVCRGTSCLPPTRTTEELIEQINEAL